MTFIDLIIFASIPFFPGTRIIYDRAFLLQCRNSPLTKTPPANLPDIPGITRVAPEGSNTIKENGHVTAAQPQQQQQQQPSPAAQRQAESKTNGQWLDMQIFAMDFVAQNFHPCEFQTLLIKTVSHYVHASTYAFSHLVGGQPLTIIMMHAMLLQMVNMVISQCMPQKQRV